MVTLTQKGRLEVMDSEAIFSAILPPTISSLSTFSRGESSLSDLIDTGRSPVGPQVSRDQGLGVSRHVERLGAGLPGQTKVGPQVEDEAHFSGDSQPVNKSRWLWFSKNTPLSTASLALGFSARAAEVRRFGAVARRLVTVPPRCVDSRTFASVVMGSPRDRAGGMRRELARSEKWFGDPLGSDGGGPMGGGADLTRFGDGSNVAVTNGDRKGKGKMDEHIRKETDDKGSDDSEKGAKGADSKTDAKQYRQAPGFEESNSNSDKGGKVDIPEYLEDMSEEEVMDHEKKMEDDSGCEVAKNTVEDNIVGLSQSEGGSQNAQNVPVERPEVQNAAAGIGITKRRTKNKKPPAVAQRFSTRIKHDGVPIQIKAQQRAGQLNDVSGISLFTSFSKTDSTVLAKIALDSGVELGKTETEIAKQIDVLKAKELAQALLCAAKQKIYSTSSSVVINDKDEGIPPVLGVLSEEGAVAIIPKSSCD
ncbi:hypothetical protein GUJ93_ZPchr0007g4160 [Zizania palustris]|uniref:Uncharacterized protein n=1 Tax=Zizania palustris TaxID=103762 RepID=A0A8J5STW9_ZIZPA|nr:hypothetical protein GUJ93_ZPchr0007g4160 [Zizania palustris]